MLSLMLRRRDQSGRLNRVKDKFDVHPERLIADTACGSGPMLDWLVTRKIAPHIPVIDKAGRPDGRWSRADFEWDAENNQYICPEGEALKQFRRNYSDPNRGPTGKGIAKYQALKHTCQTCPSKMKCCPKADARMITRGEHEDATDVTRAIRKTRQTCSSCRKKSKVFAHLKRILGLERLRFRGPCGMTSHRTAQNLRKVADISALQSLTERYAFDINFLRAQHAVFSQWAQSVPSRHSTRTTA